MTLKHKPVGIITAVIGGLIVMSFIVFANNSFRLSKEKAVMARFEILMAQQDVTAVEIIQHLDQNMAIISKENAAVIVRGLERIQKANLPKWEEKFGIESLQEKMAKVYQNNGWTLDNLSNIQDPDLKAIVLEAVSNGYKVETAEGFFFPVIDYGFSKKYRDVLPPDMAAYIEIMTVESDQTPVKDAALMISWAEILQRAERQEQYIKEYHSSTQIEAMQQLLKRYVTFVLFGANNTPLFSYDTQQMIPEAKQAYLKPSWDEKNGKFSKMMNEYLEVLKENNYKLTNEVDVYRKKKCR